MVYKKRIKPHRPAWIRRVSCVACALVVCMVCAAPMFVPADAIGDGAPNLRAYIGFDMSVMVDGNETTWFNFPLYNSISSGSIGEDLIFYGNSNDGITNYVSFLNASLTQGFLQYDMYFTQPFGSAIFEYHGLAVYPNADETVLNTLPRLRFDSDCQVGVQMTYCIVKRDYIGALTLVGRELEWHTDVFDAQVEAGRYFTLPVIGTDELVLVSDIKLLVMGAFNISTVTVEQQLVSKDAMFALNQKIFDEIPFEADVTDAGDIIGGDISDVSFTQWITTAVGGFMDFELYPGISLGGILAVLVGIAMTIVFLKIFAGG